MFCTECGTAIPEGKNFCTECGNPTSGNAPPVTAPTVPEAQESYAGQPVFQTADPVPPAPVMQQFLPYQAPVQPMNYQVPVQPAAFPGNPEAPPPKGSKYAVMGTGSYFLTMFLFFIPIAGWLVCIIMACASGNQNRRNFARASLIYLIIGLLLTIFLFVIAGWVWEAVMESIGFINGTADGAAGSILSSLFDIT